MTENLLQQPEYRQFRGTGELYSEIEIQATPGRIWEILTAFSEYPAWNPFIRQISGNLIVGETITVRLKPPGTTGMTIYPVLLAVNQDRELRWGGHLFIQGLFEGEHIFEIRPLDSHASLFVQRERFGGLLLPVFTTMLKSGTARGFSEMNNALRDRAEQAGS